MNDTTSSAAIAPGGNNGSLQVEDLNALYFYGGWSNPDYDMPYYATVGMAYNYSFCEPGMGGPNDLCGTEETTEPSGGDKPYHFQLDSGIGFMPQGLMMHPNGYVDGTPSAAGTSHFGVCALDTAGRAMCDDNLSLTVVEPVSLTVSKGGSGEGSIKIGSYDNLGDCASPCAMKFHGPYAYSWAADGENESESISLRAVPAPGSVFERWEGDACPEGAASYADGFSSNYDGNGSCSSIAMDRNRNVVAVFTKAAITMDTHNCPVMNNLYYGGTANGPVGSGLYITNMSWATKTYFPQKLECGAWSQSKSSGFLCVREKGQPESTTWSLYVEKRLWPEVVSWKAVLGMSYEGPMAESPAYEITCPAPPPNWQP